MSVRVKVSYTDEEELQDILRRLEPDVKHCKVAKRQEGTYRNAYLYMHPFDRTNKEGKSVQDPGR